MRPGAALAVALLTAACASQPPIAGTPAADPPNLVLLIGDDHGFPDFGFMGSRVVATPHLDALAAAGSVFPVGYATASVCEPSLRSLLTGLYPHQWTEALRQRRRRGTRRPRDAAIQDFQTLPRLLGRHGYATYQAGKLWDGTFAQAGFSHGMSAEKDTRTELGRAGGDALRIGRTTLQPVLDFLDAPREGPFFVWLAPLLPHVPFDSPPRYADRYADLPLSESQRGYYANVTRFDAVVGELVAQLRERGLLERTLLVYLADNGWAADSDPAAWGRGKFSIYELGFRTPVLFHAPGRVAAGRRLPALASSVDVFATLLDYAGVAVPGDRPGRSLRPVLEGRAERVREEIVGALSNVVIPRAPDARGRRPTGGAFLRSEEWHYLWYGANQQELYHVATDPGEERDVSARHPELTRRFRGRITSELERHLAQVGRR